MSEIVNKRLNEFAGGVGRLERRVDALETAPPISGGDEVTGATVRAAMVGAGDLAVRFDEQQPVIDCLWIAPDKRVVLITGS